MHPRPRHLCALLLALALAACATPPAPTSPRPGTPGFQCPAAGTDVLYSNGTRSLSRGADPMDPDVCLRPGSPERGGVARLLFNHWDADDDPNGEIRRGFVTLFPWRAESAAEFYRTTLDSRGISIVVRESWRVLRQESLAIGSGTRQAWVIRRNVEFTRAGGFRGELLIWIDQETGVVLRQVVTEIGGAWRGVQSFTTTRLRVP